MSQKLNFFKDKKSKSKSFSSLKDILLFISKHDDMILLFILFLMELFKSIIIE
jgi:hypothetical protein